MRNINPKSQGQSMPMNENPNYLIYSDGRIQNIKTGRILKPSKHVLGYHFGGKFVVNGKKRLMTLHRLVALHFIPNPDNLPEVNHLDGVKTNNDVSNLIWSDRGNNCRHAWTSGLMENAREAVKKQIGDKSPKAKLSEVQVRLIKNLKEEFNASTRELADMFNVSNSAIYSIFSGRTWSHINN